MSSTVRHSKEHGMTRMLQHTSDTGRHGQSGYVQGALRGRVMGHASRLSVVGSQDSGLGDRQLVVII